MRLAFVVALDCEAKPLLARYRLRRDGGVTAGGISVYRSADASVALAVSGVGLAAAAAATALLYATARPPRPAAWLNVGVGGHADAAPGKVFIARRVVDTNSGQRWYPPLLIDPPCACADVFSVARPESVFAEPAVYDMEAAGFYPTACRFASAETVQVVKVISDNRTTRYTALSAARVQTLVTGALATIAAAAERTAALADQLAALAAPPDGYDALLARRRFSAAERVRLRELLRRRQTLGLSAPLPDDLPGDALLSWLQQHLAAGDK